ncbi:hypothetical protein KIL84_011417 [Mauremys mutica]|uniref:Uncharacterized protein n=1 Tax=Mauremys mutica TaxID=74926 RepID=A0A9D3XEH5_9SAUR|nr:hypothetical protein KIL84_011417 [Mauremys mutica]
MLSKAESANTVNLSFYTKRTEDTCFGFNQATTLLLDVWDYPADKCSIQVTPCSVKNYQGGFCQPPHLFQSRSPSQPIAGPLPTTPSPSTRGYKQRVLAPYWTIHRRPKRHHSHSPPPFCFFNQYLPFKSFTKPLLLYKVPAWDIRHTEEPAISLGAFHPSHIPTQSGSQIAPAVPLLYWPTMCLLPKSHR